MCIDIIEYNNHSKVGDACARYNIIFIFLLDIILLFYFMSLSMNVYTYSNRQYFVYKMVGGQTIPTTFAKDDLDVVKNCR